MMAKIKKKIMSLNINKNLLLLILLLLFCMFVNIQEFLITFVGMSGIVQYADEIFALFAYIIGPYGIRKKEDKWILYLLLIPQISFVYGLIFNIVFFGVSRWNEALIQSIINSKLFLYFVIFYAIGSLRNWKKNDFQIILFSCLAISFVGIVINILEPNMFIYSEFEYELSRNRIIGFQFKPNDLAIFLGFSFTFFLLKNKKIILDIIAMVVLVFVIILSTSRTALLMLLVASLSYFFTKKSYVRIGIIRLQKVYVQISFILLITILSLALCWNSLSNVFIISETIKNFQEFLDIDSSRYIRFIMVYYGVSIAFSHFPLGVGPGNYGSVMSSGSPVYDSTGLSSMSFFQDLVGIYDSNMASTLGEYGILGFFFIYYLLYKILFHLFKCNNQIIYMVMSMVILISFSQPLFSYQVNSINILLFIFSLKENNDYSAKTS